MRRKALKYAECVMIIFTLALFSHESARAGGQPDEPPLLVVADSTFNSGQWRIQLGGFWSHPGQVQSIGVESLIGDLYTVTNDPQGNVVVGLGYTRPVFIYDSFIVHYGMEVFYLGSSTVKGNITQEKLFTDLSYQYEIQHVPVYLSKKVLMKTHSEKYQMTFDVGLGANFMRTHDYHEMRLTPFTIPPHSFGSHNNIAFSATAAIGIQMNHVVLNKSIECGFRFFYLGEGTLTKNNEQLLNTLETGNTYANALFCAILI